MVTKLYLRESHATGNVPTTTYSGRSDYFPTIPSDKLTVHDMLPAAGTTQQDIVGSYNNVGVARYTLMRLFITPELAAQTLTGSQANWKAATAQMESSTQQNQYADVFVYVYRNGSGNVKTIVGPVTDTHGDYTVETGVIDTSTGAATDFAILAGDRIVVEVWYYLNNTKSAAYDAHTYYDGATDVVDQTAASNAAAYFECPQDLKFLATKTFTVNAVLKKQTTKTFTTDAQLISKITYTKGFTVDAALKKQAPKTFTVDSILKKQTPKTFTVDSILVKRLTKNTAADSIIVKRNAKSATADSVLVNRLTKALTADSVLKKVQMKDFTVDAVPVKRITKAFTGDAVLKKVANPKTFTTDGYLVKRLTKETTVDAILFYAVSTYTKTFTVDAVIKDERMLALYVNSVDNARTGWVRTGASPYLDKSADGNYVHSMVQHSEVGDFGFEDTGQTGTPTVVELAIRCRREGDYETVRVYIDVGGGFILAGTISDLTEIYSWKKVNITTIADTFTKINALTMYMEYE